MKEVLLCKYGEIVLKGLNKGHFEKLMLRELQKRLKFAGNFSITSAQSTVYVEPMDEDADIDEALRLSRKVFGIVSVSRAAVVPKDLEEITKCVKEYIPRFMNGVTSFKADARRSDKRFKYTSPQIAGEVGGALLEAMPQLKVNLTKPDIVVMTEIRENAAYIHAGSYKGAGGMPIGSNGRALLLLSGGIDSPVAGYMIAKRGVILEALHFESYPYTSEQAFAKVITLARKVSEYSGKIKVHSVSLTELQEALRDNCNEEYFTLLLRRSMMRIADKLSKDLYLQAIVTGESLGQVASQTMSALAVTDSIATRPVFRPCIGLDKEEIICIARDIDTFDTSILPYEDCCTVFTPRHPKTQPELEKVIAQEQLIDYAAIEARAYAAIKTQIVDAYE